ncbi:hypothetical protein RJ639_011745 [Escallonia herrerae]|uniref:Uncharacterized protein n=1 Tax=Escallonia herrerae TaxID=1293975 RepID=A0AA88VLV5_9ASTE|nr:hypothetical protein RJ639_026237 [Escallonia herrerae]KAK3011172.1 hypothetical protein RJ639_011745 [Escallonia herrerae]
METGFMANAARMISSKWLKIWIEIGAVLSASELFEAQLSSSFYQLLGMADLGFLPKFFGLRSKWFNTPWFGHAAEIRVVYLIEEEVSDDEAAISGSNEASGAGNHVPDSIRVLDFYHGDCNQDFFFGEWANDCGCYWMVLSDQVCKSRELLEFNNGDDDDEEG